MSRTSIATREQRATLVDQFERPFEHVAREGSVISRWWPTDT
jgi:hypothetical protein